MAKNNFFFGKKQMSEKVQEQVQEQVQKKTEKKAPKGRRCSLMAEQVFESARVQGVMVVGYMHGRVREGDTLYVYQPEKPVMTVKVVGLELGPREIVDTAKNQQVGVGLDIQDPNEISRFAVLCNMPPVEGEMASVIIENHRLLGLTMEYNRLYQNTAYMEALLGELCYAKFLLPLYMEQPPQILEDGTVGFAKNAFVGVRPLRKPDSEDELVIPAFTDELASLAWKDAFKEGQPKRFATMQLPHLLTQINEGGRAGLVVNPFGPVAVYFSKELLEQVEKSEVFKKRYVKIAPENTENQ